MGRDLRKSGKGVGCGGCASWTAVGGGWNVRFGFGGSVSPGTTCPLPSSSLGADPLLGRIGRGEVEVDGCPKTLPLLKPILAISARICSSRPLMSPPLEEVVVVVVFFPPNIPAKPPRGSVRVVVEVAVEADTCARGEVIGDGCDGCDGCWPYTWTCTG